MYVTKNYLFEFIQETTTPSWISRNFFSIIIYSVDINAMIFNIGYK